MQLFYTAWGIVQQFIAADAKMPKEVNLPDPVDRQVVRELEARRDFPILDVIEALEPLSQQGLTQKENLTVDSAVEKEGESLLNSTIITPVPLNVK